MLIRTLRPRVRLRFGLVMFFALSTTILAHGSSRSSICVIADSGLTVSEHNAGASRAPASMVKMTLMLLVTEGFEEGSWKPSTTITVTKEAAQIGGCQVYLSTGEQFTVDQLMKAVGVLSANDAATAVAIGLWGSKEAYLLKANARIRELGMTHSEFHSIHGLPPSKGQKSDVTTAGDMALLAAECVRHPAVMAWVRLETLSFRDGESPRRATNKMLSRMPECDGLKTGYTRAAGYCVTATAKRGEIRLIAVAMGCDSLSDRFAEAQRLLEEGFKKVHRVKVLEKGQPLEATVAVDNCATPDIKLAAAEDVWFTLRAGDRVKLIARYPARVSAPVKSGTKIGAVEVKVADQILGTAPLQIPDDLHVPGLGWKLKHSVIGRKQ